MADTWPYVKHINDPEITGIDLTRETGPSTRPFVGRSTAPVVAPTQTTTATGTQAPVGLLESLKMHGQNILSSVGGVLPNVDFSNIDLSPNTPSQSEMASWSPSQKAAYEANVAAGLLSGASGGSTGPTGGGIGGTGGVASGGALTPAQAYSEAVQPREVTYENIFGTTVFDPDTGGITTTATDPFQQFQTGLMGQLSGAMQQYAAFDPAAAAQRYIDAATARTAEDRALADQTSLSRMIAGGKLGASAQARAAERLATERSIQDVQTQLMGEQFAQEQQQQQLANIGGLFNLAGGVAQQQFAPYQIALETVPTLQEIYAAPQDPLFQESMFDKQLAAQKSANKSSMWSQLLGSFLS